MRCARNASTFGSGCDRLATLNLPLNHTHVSFIMPTLWAKSRVCEQQPLNRKAIHRSHPKCNLLGGIIRLTTAAESALQFSTGRIRQPLDQNSQLDQVTHPERRAPSRHGHEHIRLRGIGPPHRHRVLPPVLVEEEHPVITPGLADTAEHEASAEQRVERVGYQNGPVLTVALGRS